MKLNGVFGVGTGKVGNSVFSSVSGEQIVRAYNPNVKNPSTSLQVDQRSRFKLASQVAAAMSSVIVIPKKRLQSSRNLFVKRNINLFYADGEGAQVSYENLQLTAGNKGLPAVTASRDNNTGVTVQLAESAGIGLDRVCYVLFKKTTEDQLQLVSSAVQNTPGSNNTYPTVLPYTAGELVIFAYGMKDTSAAAKARYGNYAVQTGEDIAKLVANRTISAADASFTETRGNTIYTDEDETITPGPGQVMIYVTVRGDGSVSATGLENGRMAVNFGTQVTLTATPDLNGSFIGWINNGEFQPFSTANPLTLTADRQYDLIARFVTQGLE